MGAEPTLGLTGATGTLGSRIAARLERDRVPARLVLRRPAAFSGSFHKAVRGDLDRSETLADAFAGLDALILVTAENPRQDAQGIAAIEAAKAAEVKRVVLLSAMLASDTAARHFGGQHGRIEAALAASGLSYTILRPSFFMQSFLLFMKDIAKGGLIIPVPTGKVAFVDVEDVAEAAILCAMEDKGAGPFVLTGSEAISFAEVAAALSELRGASVRHIAPPRWLARIALTLSEGAYGAANLDYLFRNLEAGREGAPVADLEHLLGRARAPFADFLCTELMPALNALNSLK